MDFPFGARSGTLRNDDPIESTGLGLRLRIWLGCLAGALVAAGGMWLAIAYLTGTSGAPPADPVLVRVWLPVIGLAGILAGLAMALWLDHGIAGALRGYLAALRGGQVTELRDLPAATGWGELSALGEETQRVVVLQQRMSRAFEELSRLQRQLEASRSALEHWLHAEHWEPLPTPTGPFGVVANLLNEGLTRHDEMREQNREAARQIQQDLQHSLEGASVSAEETERGFVEATSLLTTVRELQRLASDMDRGATGTLAAGAHTPDDGPSYDALRAAAAEALGELVQASGESIQHLSTGLMRVREVGEHVQVLGNRATMMALNVMVARGRPGVSSEAELAELKLLANEVRAATDRVAALSQEVEGEVGRAGQRMKGVRERVATALEAAPVTPASAPAPAAQADRAHVIERMREMIKDATVKGERLSSAGERASRAAERLVRHLEESTNELEGLVIRMSPAAEVAGALAADLSEDDTAGEASVQAAEERLAEADRKLRLLGPDDVRPSVTRRPGRENGS
jgi:hypothetical protein